MPWVGEPTIQFWQFFKHLHEDSEARSLTEIKGPARRENFLQRIFVAHYLHLAPRPSVQTKQLTELCDLCRPSQRYGLREVWDILTAKQHPAYRWMSTSVRQLWAEAWYLTWCTILICSLSCPLSLG